VFVRNVFSEWSEGMSTYFISQTTYELRRPALLWKPTIGNESLPKISDVGVNSSKLSCPCA
jgi:hypothetical protein